MLADVQCNEKQNRSSSNLVMIRLTRPSSSSHVFTSINNSTLKLIPLKVITLKVFCTSRKITFSVIALCMLQTDINSSVTTKSKLTPRMNVSSCNVLAKLVDLSSAREYHKKFPTLFYCMIFYSKILH